VRERDAFSRRAPIKRCSGSQRAHADGSRSPKRDGCQPYRQLRRGWRDQPDRARRVRPFPPQTSSIGLCRRNTMPRASGSDQPQLYHQRSYPTGVTPCRYLRGKDSKCARANPRMRPADPAGARRDAPAVTGLSAARFGLRRHRFVVVGAHTAAPAVAPLGVQPRSSVVGAPILAGRRSRAMCMAACGHPSTSHCYRSQRRKLIQLPHVLS
jgi:hypothetical protein